jgi:2-hydroxychromene-2-carboxylate isomerase
MEATWYFDVVSPYAYLALGEVEELGRTIPITYKPVLFAGLLKHYGHLGPAEIPSKRIHTYRLCIFEAQRRGIELSFPPVGERARFVQ